jgi:signal transduction histidine kinase
MADVTVADTQLSQPAPREKQVASTSAGAAAARAEDRPPAGPQASSDALLLDIAVHELRSPLTVIQGYASLLEGGDLGGLDAAALKAVRVIAAKAREAQEMATSLLTVARLESNELRIEPTPTPLRPLLEAAHDRVGPRLELAGASLDVECPDGLEALADAELVARILDNLVNNALIYSDPPATVGLVARPAAGWVEIRVSDRGPGVPEDDRERIFERFVRGAGAERAAGTGLGLYVSRECARRMGGDLSLEASGPGQGSTFLLRLPAVRGRV